MEWTKIKCSHFLWSTLTDAQLGQLGKILSLVATLERIPISKELMKICTKTQVERLENYFSLQGKSLEFIMEKVLEDVKSVETKRASNRSRQKDYREKHEKDNALHNAPEKRREEKRREERKEKRFSPPSIEELKKFIKEKGYLVNAITFFNHYESNGWLVGKNKMKSWQAAVANWNSRDKEEKKPTVAKKEIPDYMKEMIKANRQRIGAK